MTEKVAAAALAILVFGFRLQSEELALDQAVRIALQHNADVANAALDVSKSKDRYSASHTSVYPKLSLYMLGSEQLKPITTTIDRGTIEPNSPIGPIPSQDVHFTTPMQPTGFVLGRVAQPLLTLYRIHLNLKSLEYMTQIAEQKARSKRQETVRNVKQLYYAIEQVQSSLVVTGESIALYKEVERLTDDYVLKQTALESDLLQAQATLADAEQSELTLTNQEAKQKEQLNDLLGRDVLTEFTVSSVDEAQKPELDLVAARKRALAQRPELKQAQLKVKQSEQELRAKKAEYIPDISAEFNSVTLLNFNSFLPNGSYSVGVSLSWEPFDWGRKKSEMAEKRDTIVQDRNTESSTERKVIMDVDDKYRQILQSWSKLRAAHLSQKAALESLRVSKNQYKVQASLLKVVLQSQTALAQANSDYEHALADYWTAQAEFEYALGEDQ
ncbi:MAG: TolC family protein [Acidobacteriaceae bacterium]|nr:TolC family protein [Acidobacteriaceae bacterium]